MSPPARRGPWGDALRSELDAALERLAWSGLPSGELEREAGLAVLSVLLRHQIRGARILARLEDGALTIEITPPEPIPRIERIRVRCAQR